MGLDMYLEAKKYFSPADFRPEDDRKKFNAIVEVCEVEEYLEDFLPHLDVSVAVGYWRKSNHIHKWFVDNVQDGEDRCQESYVGREQLEELKEICRKVIDSPSSAEDILPTTEGFFFGGTEYDDYYYEALEETIKIIDKCLSMPAGWDFFYRSSW